MSDHHPDAPDAASPRDPNPPTIAAFPPPSASSPVSRSSVHIHQKSPLLTATPPQVTRALSLAYPLARGLNFIAGLLTWTTDDPWECFLLVALFWAFSLYGDFLLQWGGNILAAVVLIAGMYLRRYQDEPPTTTLDEVLETFNTLSARVQIFFTPLLVLTNFLSSPQSAVKATTRPALTTLFIRILLTTPLWLALAVYPFQLITPRRIIISSGTLILTYHSRPAKVLRAILRRSQTLRLVAGRLTGVSLTPNAPPPPLPPRSGQSDEVATKGISPSTSGATPGVKFTFSVYENQRRWLGVGWTSSMFPNERAAWTDEHLQPCSSTSEFKLPQPPEGAGVRWRWVQGEDWTVDGGNGGNGHGGKSQDIKDRLGGPGEAGEGWWYYDNKWRDGRRGVDGWGKYTRRRKWVRRAELVEGEELEEPEKETNGHNGNPIPEVKVETPNESEAQKEVQKEEAPTKPSPERTPPPLPARPPRN